MSLGVCRDSHRALQVLKSPVRVAQTNARGLLLASVGPTATRGRRYLLNNAHMQVARTAQTRVARGRLRILRLK